MALILASRTSELCRFGSALSVIALAAWASTFPSTVTATGALTVRDQRLSFVGLQDFPVVVGLWPTLSLELDQTANVIEGTIGGGYSWLTTGSFMLAVWRNLRNARVTRGRTFRHSSPGLVDHRTF